MTELHVLINTPFDDLRGAIGTLGPHLPGWKTTTFRTGCHGVQIYAGVDTRPLELDKDRIQL